MGPSRTCPGCTHRRSAPGSGQWTGRYPATSVAKRTARITPLPGHGPDDDEPVSLLGTERGFQQSIDQAWPATARRTVRSRATRLYAACGTISSALFTMRPRSERCSDRTCGRPSEYRDRGRGRFVPGFPIRWRRCAATQTILAALQVAGRDNWGHALWLHVPSSAFGGRTAAELLRDGEFEAVLTAAEPDAMRWAQ